MNIVKRYDYVALERTTLPSGFRYYLDPVTGAHLPSVTTILDQTSHKPELEAWKLAVGPKKAQEVKQEATALGSLMHLHLECHIQGLERPKGNNMLRQLAERMADTIIARGLVDVDECWGTECPIHYPGLYAGTMDLPGIYQGKPAIMDFKTSKVMRTLDWIDDYLCQLSAYALANNLIFGTDIQTVVIFMVTRDLQFKAFVIEGKDYEAAALRWTDRVAQYVSKEE